MRTCEIPAGKPKIRRMLILFTDFGSEGPYVGQLHTVLRHAAPGIPIIDLMHDAPAHDPRAAAYLLAALAPFMPEGCTCVAVVDPGVGGSRLPLVVRADGRSFVGPGNGLFELVMRRAERASAEIIDWSPPQLSHSFHGRDLFAPVAAMLATGLEPPLRAAAERHGADWPDDLPEAIYTDRFGNVMTGLRAASIDAGAIVVAGDTRLRAAATFVDVPPGRPFWYENSLGLVEIAVNRGSAARTLGLEVGDAIEIVEP